MKIVNNVKISSPQLLLKEGILANDDILTQPFELKPAKFENNAGMLGVALLLLERI